MSENLLFCSGRTVFDFGSFHPLKPEQENTHKNAPEKKIKSNPPKPTDLK